MRISGGLSAARAARESESGARPAPIALPRKRRRENIMTSRLRIHPIAECTLFLFFRRAMNERQLEINTIYKTQMRIIVFRPMSPDRSCFPPPAAAADDSVTALRYA